MLILIKIIEDVPYTGYSLGCNVLASTDAINRDRDSLHVAVKYAPCGGTSLYRMVTLSAPVVTLPAVGAIAVKPPTSEPNPHTQILG